MVCPNCFQVNPAGAAFCISCRYALSQPTPAQATPANANPSPFEDYLPGWMQPGAAKPASPTPAAPAPSGGSLGFSLDDLLRATEVATSAPPPPAAPLSYGGFPAPANYAAPPPPAAPANPFMPTAPAAAPVNPFAAPAPAPAPVSTAVVSVDDLLTGSFASTSGPAAQAASELPLPAFNEPPLWSRTTGSARTEPPLTSSTMPPGVFSSQPPQPQQVAGETYGIERGHYFYTNEHGELVLHQLAGFFRRFGAAAIDWVIAALVVIIFDWLVGFRIYGMILVGSSDASALQTAARAGNDVAMYRATAGLVNLAILALGLMTSVVSLLYYILTTTLLGSTIGQRVLGLGVLTKGRGTVTVASAAIRSFYGAVPGLLGLFLTSSFFQMLANAMVYGANNPAYTRAISQIGTEALIMMGIHVFFFLGFLWALFDSAHQGLHDKLARTYVVWREPS